MGSVTATTDQARMDAQKTLTVTDHGRTISGVAGMERIDVKWMGSYAETTLFTLDGEMLSYDLEGLVSFGEGINKALELATELTMNNADSIDND